MHTHFRRITSGADFLGSDAVWGLNALLEDTLVVTVVGRK